METKPNRLKPEEQKLVEEHLPLVKRVADRRSLNRYRLLGEEEDVMQEAALGLMRAAATFNPAKGCAFAPYACICMRNRLNQLRKKAMRQVCATSPERRR